MEILNIKNLTFQYPQSTKYVLENVSLTVNAGDFVLICGASGSGKTTLLRLLNEKIAPFGKKSGSIVYNNDVSVSFVGQDTENQIVSDTVWHNLAFAAENANMSREKIRSKVAEIAEFFDLTQIFHKNTYLLSGGEKQLLNLASSLVTYPDILILDEPTAQLDPISAGRFLDVVKRLNEETGITIIISEHSCESLWNFTEKVYIMKNGTLFNGTAADINSEYVGLPKGYILYNSLKGKGKKPLTVPECRSFLKKNFKSDIDTLNDPTKEGTTALQLKSIYFRYEKNSPDILKNLNLRFSFGEILTILGSNGSGKSTLLGILCENNKPYSGKVKLFGKKVAVLPQMVKSVFTKDSVREDLELISADYNEISEKLGIETLLDRNPYDLSGGEMQRAALAKVLLLNPDVLILDEPTNGIDAKGKNDIQRILKSIADRGVCVIIVSHDVDFAAEISDKCALLFDGEITSLASPREFFSHNTFYTTFASQISRHMYKNTVTLSDIIELCKRNGTY